MLGDMQDQKRRNSLVPRHVRDCRIVLVFRGIVAKLLAMAKLGLRQIMYATAGLGHLDDGRYVKRISIDGDAALDDAQRQTLGLQEPIIGADDRSQLRTGGMAHDEKSLRITAVL